MLLSGFSGESVLEGAAEQLRHRRGAVILESHGFKRSNPPAGFPPEFTWEEISSLAWTARHDLASHPEIRENDLLSRVSSRYWQFARLVDRSFLRPISQKDLALYFSSLIRVSSLILEGNDHCDSVVFASTPHLPPEFTLGVVAEALKVPVVVLRPTQVPDLIIASLGVDLKRDNWIRTETPPLSFKADVLTLHSPRVELSRRINHGMAKIPRRRVVLWSLIARTYRITPVYEFLFGLRRRPPLAVPSYSFLSRKESSRVLRAAIVHRRKMIRVLGRLSSQEKSTDEYVYFALSYQPERTSDPEAGLFSNLLLGLRTVQKVVSEVAPLSFLVKEHPKQHQFPPQVREWAARDSKFYELAASLPKTSLVPSGTDSRDLIRGARLVATTSGSAAWEALVTGRPALTLCPTWLDGCKSVVDLSSIPDPAEGVRRLLALSEKEVRDSVVSFLNSRSEFFINSVISDRHLSKNLSCEHAAQNLAQFLDGALPRLPDSKDWRYQ